MAAQERVRLASGVELSTQRIEGEGPTLVFLHEGLGSIAQWKGFPDALCDELNLPGLVYDRSGYGGSTGTLQGRQVTYLHEAAVELQAFIHNTVEGPYWVIGHSDGGSIALIHAAGQPRNLIGCVTLAAHVIVEQETVDGIAPAVQAFEEGKLAGLSKYHPGRVEEVFYAWADIWRTDAFRTWDICNLIKTINVPTLSMQGDQDQYGTIRQLELIQEHVPAEVEVDWVEGAGHSPHLQTREHVLQRITQFIRSHS